MFFWQVLEKSKKPEVKQLKFDSDSKCEGDSKVKGVSNGEVPAPKLPMTVSGCNGKSDPPMSVEKRRDLEHELAVLTANQKKQKKESKGAGKGKKANDDTTSKEKMTAKSKAKSKAKTAAAKNQGDDDDDIDGNPLDPEESPSSGEELSPSDPEVKKAWQLP